MSKKMVTIIIPVYNVKKYLLGCMVSILNQTYQDIEVIIIDDGSIDGSSEICDNIAKMDTRVRIIHQNNLGAASARKRGIQEAHGEFICFVDADDKIDTRMVETLIGQIGECDMVTSGCYCENSNGEYRIRTDAFEPGIYTKGDKLEYLISNMIVFHDSFEDGLLPFLVNKMFKAKLAKKVAQNIEISLSQGEDRDFLYRYILDTEAVCITHEIFYYYQYRADSIMRSENCTYMKDLNCLYLTLKEAFQTHSQKESLIHQLQLFIALRTHYITWYMGFSLDTQSITNLFPYTEMERNKKIVLYGAGKVGKDYYRQLYRQTNLHIVLWVDREWKKKSMNQAPIVSPECIFNCEYDYIVIAVKEKELSYKIRGELIDKGISEKKILWKPPVKLEL